MKHPAIEFLSHLDSRPEARFNIEVIEERPRGAAKRPGGVMRRYPDLEREDAEALLPELERLNEQGCGIYVTRNEMAGQRSSKNLRRIRGLHADLDDVDEERLRELKEQLEPSIIVQTSGPRNQHFYWNLSSGEEMAAEEAKALNQAMAAYGADKAAVDPARLLRLPGFKHMKDRANGHTPVVTATYSGQAYTNAQLRQAFQCSSSPMPPSPTSPGHDQNHESVAAAVRARCPDLWDGRWQAVRRKDGSTGYPSQSEADLALASIIALEAQRRCIPAESLRAVVEAVFTNSALGQSEKWQDRPDYRARTIAKALEGKTAPELAMSEDEGASEHAGDVRNAKVFAEMNKGKVHFVTGKNQWLYWDGHRWKICERQEHVHRAKDVGPQLRRKARLATDSELRKCLAADAKRASMCSGIDSLIRLAQSEPGVAVTPDQLNADRKLIGVKSGVVNLQTGKLQANAPQLLITQYADALYDPAATRDRWLSFLKDVFGGDSETIASLQRLAGYTLLGSGAAEIMVICYGNGANGKSVFNNVLISILGDYAKTSPASLLVARRPGDVSPRNDIAALHGARLVSVNELQDNESLDEQTVKQLASRELISARHLYGEFFEFEGAFTVWLRTNHKPVIRGDDDGIWRRIVLVPFLRTFAEGERDPHLQKKLLEERDGIFAWIVEGARMYLKDGLSLSPLIKREVNTYRQDSDVLGTFLEEKTEQAVDFQVDQADLYRSYDDWARLNGIRSMSKTRFTRRLKERGFGDAKSGKNRFYVGLRRANCFTEAPKAGEKLPDVVTRLTQ